MSDTRLAIEVFVFGPKGFGGSLLFATPQVTIGRDPRSQVHLDDPSVSLRHAVLDVVGDSVCARDLGSRSGTLVNGRAISQQVTLQPTDDLIVGSYRLRLTIHRPEATQPAPGSSTQPRAISVPTPMEEIRFPGASRLARPATQRMEPPARIPPRFDSIDEEVTATGVVAAKPPPRAADDQPPARDGLDMDLDAFLARPGTERAFNAVPPSAAESPRRSPAPMGGATVPLSFESAMLLPAQARSAPAPKERTVKRAEAPAVAPPPVLPFAGRPASYEDDDEDDDDDFVPPFDLLQVLTRVGSHADVAGMLVTVEAIHYREDRIFDIRHVAPGHKLRIAGLLLGSRDRSGVFVLNAKLCESATVRQHGQRLSEDEVEVLSALGLTLTAGMQVVVQLAQDDRVLVQIVPQAPALSPIERRLRPMLEELKPGAWSAGVHLLLLVVFGITMLRGKNAIADDVNEGRFATIALQPVEIEPPPPPKELPPSVDKSLSIPIRASRREPSTPGKPNAKVADRPPDHEAKDDSSASASSILKALGGPATPEISALNMDAMPKGRSGFRVSDAVGKGPGDTLRVGVGNADGAVNTKTAAELGDVGKLEVKPGTGAVRARVSAVPAGVSGEGHLDRGAIQKVVNAHLYQVQGCYEHQLANNPGLAGKATFQWVINPSGAVSGVRIAQSSIASVEVMSCIQGAIQRWSFPKPEGGSVTVTYPFAFTTFGN